MNTAQTPPSASAPRTPPLPQPEEPPRSETATTAPENSVEVLPTASSSNKRKPRPTRGEEGSKRSRVAAGIAKEYAPPTVRLADLGGMDPCIEKVLELVAMPLTHPEVYLHTGIQPPRGVLLHGPSGCGKTLLANAIGGVRTPQTRIIIFSGSRIFSLIQELGLPFISISAPSIVSGMSGESEKTLRETFEEAKVRFPFAKVANPLNHKL